MRVNSARAIPRPDRADPKYIVRLPQRHDGKIDLIPYFTVEFAVLNDIAVESEMVDIEMSPVDLLAYRLRAFAESIAWDTNETNVEATADAAFETFANWLIRVNTPAPPPVPPPASWNNGIPTREQLCAILGIPYTAAG